MMDENEDDNNEGDDMESQQAIQQVILKQIKLKNKEIQKLKNDQQSSKSLEAINEAIEKIKKISSEKKELEGLLKHQKNSGRQKLVMSPPVDQSQNQQQLPFIEASQTPVIKLNQGVVQSNKPATIIHNKTVFVPQVPTIHSVHLPVQSHAQTVQLPVQSHVQTVQLPVQQQPSV